MTLNKGLSGSLSVSYTYVGKIDATKFKWASSKPSVATVKNGVVKAVKPGTTKITVSMDGKQASCNVTVKYIKPTFVSTTQCYTSLNNYRKKAKVPTLKRDPSLESIAKIRAKELVKKFDHVRPNGTRGLSLITKKGIWCKGENIAKGQTTCIKVSEAWYNSKGHRANMLRKQFKKVGIAGYKYNGVMYWVQLFSS